MALSQEGTPYVMGGLLAAVLVQLLLLGFRGQNLGKLAIGGQVVRASDGGPAGFVRAGLLRFLLPLAIFFILNGFLIIGGFVFLLVDLCFMFGEERRCLHDLIAGTKVVKR